MSNPTIITDENIKGLVKSYLKNKSELPSDLIYVPIGDWDVSNVTDMSKLFSDMELLNESLNNWNVSNVTNMSLMFTRCTSFNQPLDKWNVSNVTNMDGMFFFVENLIHH